MDLRYFTKQLQFQDQETRVAPRKACNVQAICPGIIRHRNSQWITTDNIMAREQTKRRVRDELQG